jgi:hypothetical protein
MFTLFHLKKLRYNKGQLMPLFIAVLAVIIILTMLTVNISKVAQYRTEASNGVDAGALAGGSVLAGVFNQVSVSNQDMYNAYILFVLKMGISFTIAEGYLLAAGLNILEAEGDNMAAQAVACTPFANCTGKIEIKYGLIATKAAISEMKMFNRIMVAIALAYTAYKMAQAEFYDLIRQMAEKGWQKGIKIAHSFNFTNSKTGSKLKSKKMGALEDKEDANNYYDAFSDFMDSLDNNSDYWYNWTDGQGRPHSTHSKVYIQPVDDFKLRTMLNPYPVEMVLFVAMYALGYIALGELAAAAASFATAAPSMEIACDCSNCCGYICPCWPCLTPACATAQDALIVSFNALFDASWKLLVIAGLIIDAEAGLVDAWDINDKGAEANPISLWTICWIQDINHDRRVQVWQDQTHDKGDLGLLKTQYPKTSSWSESNIEIYTTDASIFPYGPHFDPSLEAVDNIGS